MIANVRRRSTSWRKDLDSGFSEEGIVVLTVLEGMPENPAIFKDWGGEVTWVAERRGSNSPESARAPQSNRGPVHRAARRVYEARLP